VFETAFGIPAHPLLVHVPVVFVPLLILGSLAYGLVPAWRQRIDWAVVALAVLTPISCFVARQSGLAFRSRLVHNHTVSSQDLTKIDTHQSFGTRTLILSCVLGVLALVLVAVTVARRRRAAGGGSGFDPLSLGVLVLVVVASAFMGYYVFKTGDTGAHIVWQGR
jgi:glucan phosphoethanolaminetransferase (alkaline phosphatase superfamily)